jgi:hypothetical protein
MIAVLQLATKRKGGERLGMVYVAVDVGKRRCVTCVMDEDGSILEIGSYPNTTFDASRYARLIVEKHGECKAVVESTGSVWMKTYEAFESNASTMTSSERVASGGFTRYV